MNLEFRKSKYTGCLIGLAVGDALGAPFEFWSGKKVNEHIDTKGLNMHAFLRGEVEFPTGFYTDDTSQMICLAESLVEKGFDLDDQFQRYRSWFFEGYATPFGDTQYGIGQQTLKVLMMPKRPSHNVEIHIEKAGGNGSLMRCAPIGLKYQGDYNEINDKSFRASHLTHPNRIASWSCVVLNTIISLCIDGYDKRQVLQIIRKRFKNELPTEIIECISTDYTSMNSADHVVCGYSLTTLGVALWAWLTSETFEMSIERAIRLGSDTDTFAAVTGAITGSYYGIDKIPNVWKAGVLRSEYIQQLGERLMDKDVV